MSNHLIAIYGAVGHTGRQVVTELARRGYRLRLGARNAEIPAGGALAA